MRRAARGMKVTVVNKTPFALVRQDPNLYDFEEWTALPDDTVPIYFIFTFYSTPIYFISRFVVLVMPY